MQHNGSILLKPAPKTHVLHTLVVQLVVLVEQIVEVASGRHPSGHRSRKIFLNTMAPTFQRSLGTPKWIPAKPKLQRPAGLRVQTPCPEGPVRDATTTGLLFLNLS